MADAKKGGIVAAKPQTAAAVVKAAASKSVALAMGELLDKEGYRKRINELLGKRAPQFVGSLVSLVNSDPNMQRAFGEAPVTIIQSALRAATYDLPIDPGLGFAYIVPFNNKKKDDKGRDFWRMEASFILGYKGMLQLAMRTGAYKKINVTDVREGELVSFDRLTEDFEFEWIDDDAEREKKPVVGYCGYYRLANGAEKVVYMSAKAIQAHEAKFRKGKYQSKGWRDDFDAMARKTVLRNLLGKWGMMSIDYRAASESQIRIAEDIAKGSLDDENFIEGQKIDDVTPEDKKPTTADGREIDPDTGEIIPAAEERAAYGEEVPGFEMFPQE